MRLRLAAGGLIALAIPLSLSWPAAALSPPPVVPDGFGVETFYSGPPLTQPLELAFDRAGNLLVSNSGFGTCSSSNGAVYAISPSRSISTVVGAGLLSPKGLAIGPGGTWGRNLYIGDTNIFGCRGAVLRVESGSLTTLSVGSPFPGDIGEPGRLAFGPGGAFGRDLYVANKSSPGEVGDGSTGGVFTVDPAGSQSTFLFGPPLVDPVDVTFAPRGRWHSRLYLADYAVQGGTGSIWAAGPAGELTLLADGPPLVDPMKLAFGPGGRFGKDLYVRDVTAGTIFKVDRGGTISVFASGLAPGSYDLGIGMVFGPSGRDLYVINGTDVIRIFVDSGGGEDDDDDDD